MGAAAGAAARTRQKGEAAAAAAAARLAVWPDAWADIPPDAVAIVAGKFRPAHRGHGELLAGLAMCVPAVVVCVQDCAAPQNRGIGTALALETLQWLVRWSVPEDAACEVFLCCEDPQVVAADVAATGATPVHVVSTDAFRADTPRAGICVVVPAMGGDVSSTLMASVPPHMHPGSAAHVAHVRRCLPWSAPRAHAGPLAERLAAACVRGLFGGGAGAD